MDCRALAGSCSHLGGATPFAERLTLLRRGCGALRSATKEVGVAQLDIDTAAVTQTGAAVASAPSGASPVGVTITPPASDPVSAAVTETLQAQVMPS